MNVQSVQQGIGSLWSGVAGRFHLENVHLPAKVTDWSKMSLDKLHLPNIHLPGFRFAETMSGTAYLNGEKKDMVFEISAEAPDLWAYFKTGRTHIAGKVSIEGLAKDAPLRGELWIHLFHRVIRYEFSFRATDGRLLSFTGQKDLKLLHPVFTLKNLPGDIRDEHGREVAKTKLHFRTKDLPSFLYSFRPILH